jgi:hypothetical protein
MYVLVLSPGAWGRALTKAVVNGMMAFRERQGRRGEGERQGGKASLEANVLKSRTSGIGLA